MSLHLQPSPVADSTDTAPSAERPIRVVLADDHPAMRRSLRRLLDREADVDVVAEADDLTMVVNHVRNHRPHVLVLDLRMPAGSSIDTIRRLRKEVPGTEIVVLTMEDSPAFAQQAIDVGAIGFVVKDSAEVELSRAVRAAELGERYISPRVTASSLELGLSTRSRLARYR